MEKKQLLNVNQMKNWNICKNFTNKIQINKKNLYFLYDGKEGNQFNEKLTFEEMINLGDKKRKKNEYISFSK